MVLPLHDDNPTTTRPYVTLALIAICVALYLWERIAMTDDAAQRLNVAFGVIPVVLTGQMQLPSEFAVLPPFLTVLTSIFLHGGLIHVAVNMWFLWIFGNNIEDAMGHARFLIFYLICGVASVLGHVYVDPASEIPLIGASGAVSGVLGAYFLMHPGARVLLGLPIGFLIIQLGRYKAGWVLGAWFAWQVLNSVLPSAPVPGGALVAFMAHVAGFLAGILLIPLFKRRHVPLWQRH
jgi:membrane associated rhomboid family serine protease